MKRTTAGSLVAGGIIVAFLIGFVWQYVRAHALQQQLQQAQHQVTDRSLETTLAAATIEALRGGYEPARELASQFFTGLQTHLAAVPVADRMLLQQILQRRDSTITLLARGNARAGDELTDLFIHFRVATGDTPPPLAYPVGAGAAPAGSTAAPGSTTTAAPAAGAPAGGGATQPAGPAPARPGAVQPAGTSGAQPGATNGPRPGGMNGSSPATPAGPDTSAKGNR